MDLSHRLPVVQTSARIAGRLKKEEKAFCRRGWEPLQQPAFTLSQRDGLLDLLTWRRDVRAFQSDPLPAGTLERLIATACLSPSVGLSEPWRFVIVDDPVRREAVRRNFEAANAEALAAQDMSRQALYARLKLTGLDDAPAHIAVFADPDDAQGHGLGRHTMADAIDHSVAIAIHTLWLAARLEGIGVGWVSILDPTSIADVLDVPASWRLIGYLCIGYPVCEDDRPALERAGWEARRGPKCRILRR